MKAATSLGRHRPHLFRDMRPLGVEPLKQLAVPDPLRILVHPGSQAEGFTRAHNRVGTSARSSASAVVRAARNMHVPEWLCVVAVST